VNDAGTCDGWMNVISDPVRRAALVDRYWAGIAHAKCRFQMTARLRRFALMRSVFKLIDRLRSIIRL